MLCVIGTRPEAIKMAPVVAAMRRRPGLDCRICVSGQHREMLDQVLEVFGLEPDHDLAVMEPDQTLNGLGARMISRFDAILQDARFERIVVHGDTTTAMAAALAAFHRQLPVAHVEAGLRTYDMRAPWPEEFNRRAIDLISDMLFAPTPASAGNLSTERLAGRVIVTGNTVVDSLTLIVDRLDRDAAFRTRVEAALPKLDARKPLLLATCHRREHFGEGLLAILSALRTLAEKGVQVVLPVHRNPNVWAPVHAQLGGVDGMHLVEPLDYPQFVSLLARADVVLTDSGGVQEEAASLGKPLLIMREATERPEALAGSHARLVGSDPARIVAGVLRELKRPSPARGMIGSVYGDGQAAERIADALCGLPVREFAPAPALLSASVA